MKCYMAGILLCLFAFPVLADKHELQSCKESTINIDSLVTPIEKNVKIFLNGKLMVYNIDEVEPAAASHGIALVVRNGEAGESENISRCFAVRNFAYIDATKARLETKNQTTLIIPLKELSPSGDIKDAKETKLELFIDTAHATVNY